MQNRFEIIITPEAQQDLKNIWVYSYETWSEKQADKFLDTLLTKINSLQEYPDRGVKRDDFGENLLALYLKPHIIVYKISEVVTIIRIFDGRSDLNSVLL